MQEQKVSTSSYFITLTYDTLSVPITKRRRMGLYKRHLQLFFKRIRRVHDRARRDMAQKPKSIKYYAVGEYGGRTKRPHYHCIVFNIIPELLLSKRDELALKMSNYDGKTEVRIKQWKDGHCTIGQVTEASVGYTLKYISKGRTIPEYPGDDRVPEFSIMSKRLGANYLTKATIRWHTNDVEQRVYCIVPGGIKISMPRYYKDRIYSSEQRGKIAGYFEAKLAEEQAKFYGSSSRPTPLDYMQQEWNRMQAIKASFRKQKSKQKIDLL